MVFPMTLRRQVHQHQHRHKEKKIINKYLYGYLIDTTNNIHQYCCL